MGAMMKNLFYAACIFFASCSIAAAELPESGACNAEGEFSSVSLTWSNGEVQISNGEHRYKSIIIGMRKHDEQFKFSTFYIDDIAGLTELVVFAYTYGGEVSYRVGWVTYDEAPTGERVIGSISGFTDATCVVLP